jgi:hypothetical protein
VSIRELKRLLDEVADTRELVVRRHTWSASYDAWSDAAAEAREAYGMWLSAPTAEAYAVYRAAQDREDAAQDMLAYSHTSRRRVS